MEKEKPSDIVFGIIGIIVFGGLAILIFKKVFPAVTGYFDDRSSKKVYCAERADSASTSYAAKKIYKACMSR